MNIKIVIGVAVLIAVAIGLWLSLGKEAAEAPTVPTSDGSAMSADEINEGDAAGIFSGTGSFEDLLGMGRNLTCDFSYVAEDTNGAVAGTVRVSGERMRGDFEMEQAGETYYSHMIQDGEMIYTWSESPMGDFAIAMSVEEGEAASTADAGETEYSRPVDMSNDVDYDCRAWNVDASVFTPPSDIEFMSMEEMFQNMMPEGFDMSDYQ